MTVKYLAAGAFLLGALATIAGSPRRDRGARVDVSELANIVDSEEDHVTAIELAGWIKDQRPGLRLVDLRDSSDFDAYHIPRAERIDLNEMVKTPFGHDETIVLYSEGGAHAAQGWVFLRALGHRKVYFLRGGLYEWLDQVMNPALSPGATDSMRTEFEAVAALSRYFGGVPRIGEQGDSQPSLPVPESRAEDRPARNAVARVRGRGC